MKRLSEVFLAYGSAAMFACHLIMMMVIPIVHGALPEHRQPGASFRQRLFGSFRRDTSIVVPVNNSVNTTSSDLRGTGVVLQQQQQRRIPVPPNNQITTGGRSIVGGGRGGGQIRTSPRRIITTDQHSSTNEDDEVERHPIQQQIDVDHTSSKIEALTLTASNITTSTNSAPSGGHSTILPPIIQHQKTDHITSPNNPSAVLSEAPTLNASNPSSNSQVKSSSSVSGSHRTPLPSTTHGMENQRHSPVPLNHQTRRFVDAIPWADNRVLAMLNQHCLDPNTELAGPGKVMRFWTQTPLPSFLIKLYKENVFREFFDQSQWSTIQQILNNFYEIEQTLNLPMRRGGGSASTSFSSSFMPVSALTDRQKALVVALTAIYYLPMAEIRPGSLYRSTDRDDPIMHRQWYSTCRFFLKIVSTPSIGANGAIETEDAANMKMEAEFYAKLAFKTRHNEAHNFASFVGSMASLIHIMDSVWLKGLHPSYTMSMALFDERLFPMDRQSTAGQSSLLGTSTRNYTSIRGVNTQGGDRVYWSDVTLTDLWDQCTAVRMLREWPDAARTETMTRLMNENCSNRREERSMARIIANRFNLEHASSNLRLAESSTSNMRALSSFFQESNQAVVNDDAVQVLMARWLWKSRSKATDPPPSTQRYNLALL